MREVIARVEAYDPHIHAPYLFAPERALAEAQAATARWARGTPKDALDGVPVTLKDNIATRSETVFSGFGHNQEFAEISLKATAPFDLLISPTAPITAYPADWASPSQDPLDPYPPIGFPVAFTMSGQPAASINAGFDAQRLPIGLPIVGKRFDDLGVLALARAYEDIRSAPMLDWPQPS